MMDADFLTTYAWIFWLALILVCVIIEVTTLEFTFLMIAVGSLGGLVSGLLGLPWWAQIIVAAVLSLVLLLFVRPALLKVLKKGGDPAKSNVDALLGQHGTVTADFQAGTGYVKLSNGETWTSKLPTPNDGHELEIGDRVVVTAIEGATAVVVPVERTAQ